MSLAHTIFGVLPRLESHEGVADSVLRIADQLSERSPKLRTALCGQAG